MIYRLTIQTPDRPLVTEWDTFTYAVRALETHNGWMEAQWQIEGVIPGPSNRSRVVAQSPKQITQRRPRTQHEAFLALGR